MVPRSLFSNLGEDEEKMAVEELRRAQQIIGELQWLTTHTRPDIVYHLGLMARSAHRRPKQVVKMGMELLRYLSSTKTKGLHYQKSSMQKPYGFLMLSGDHSCFVHCLHFIFCCKQCSSPANPTLDLSAKRRCALGPLLFAGHPVGDPQGLWPEECGAFEWPEGKDSRTHPMALSTVGD